MLETTRLLREAGGVDETRTHCGSPLQTYRCNGERMSRELLMDSVVRCRRARGPYPRELIPIGPTSTCTSLHSWL